MTDEITLKASSINSLNKTEH